LLNRISVAGNPDEKEEKRETHGGAVETHNTPNGGMSTISSV